MAYDNETDVRNEVIEFLNDNAVRGTIKQCVRTTYQFKSDDTKDVLWWNKAISSQLSLDYYTVSEIKLGDRTDNKGNRFYELKKKCNPDLQESLEEVLEKLNGWTVPKKGVY